MNYEFDGNKLAIDRKVLWDGEIDEKPDISGMALILVIKLRYICEYNISWGRVEVL